MTTETSIAGPTAANANPEPVDASAPSEHDIVVSGPLIGWMHTLVGRVRSDCPDLTNRQMALLLVVHLVEGAPSVRRLASHLGVGKPIVSRALDTLEKMGYLRRRRGIRDRRDIFVERTPEGASFLAELASAMADPFRSERPDTPAPQA